MSKFEEALNNPHSVYALPKEVVADASLTKEQKLKVLIQWEYDARELMVADEENMTAEDSPSLLNRVLNAIHELDPDYKSDYSGTKHG